MKYLIFTLLTSLTIALFASACVAGQTAASAPLVVNLPQSTQAPQTAHVPPAEVVVKPRLVPPGLRVEGAVYPLVLDRFYALAYMYPDVAKRTTKIVARRLPKAWIISYEARTIYVNVWYGDYVVADKLTEQFARRAYDYLKRYQPHAAKSFKSWRGLMVAWIRTGVR